MSDLQTPVIAGQRLRRKVRSVPAADARAFLAAAHGEVRGYWGRGDRWVAWAGELARVQVGPGGKNPSRFTVVRDQAETLGRKLFGDAVSDGRKERPRFFGGFSFLDGGPHDPTWDGFSRACFILPRTTLRSTPGEALLTHWVPGEAAQGQAPGGGDLLPVSTGSEGRGEGPQASIAGSLNGDSMAELARRARSAAPADQARWSEAVQAVLEAISRGEVEKAVLARILDLEISQGLTGGDPMLALERLRRENPRAHVFLFEPEPGRIFMGAAPEILTELRGRRFQATAVAGSISRGDSEAKDRVLARQLLESDKDLQEHRLTAVEMSEVLAPRLASMVVGEEPRVLRLARIQHLETVIRGMARPEEDVLSLVEALHPTPAVCGRPRERALELIRDAEPFDRGGYAGPVGWFDGAGDGDFVPAIRSAVGGGSSWRLFAGAGIVPGSLPQAEWEETALKFEPALRALVDGLQES